MKTYKYDENSDSFDLSTGGLIQCFYESAVYYGVTQRARSKVVIPCPDYLSGTGSIAVTKKTQPDRELSTKLALLWLKAAGYVEASE